MKNKVRRAKHKRKRDLPTASYAAVGLGLLAVGASVGLGSQVQAEELSSSTVGILEGESSHSLSQHQVEQAHESAQSAGRLAELQKDLVSSTSHQVSELSEELSTVQGQILEVESVTEGSVSSASESLLASDKLVEEARDTVSSAQSAVSTASESVSKHAEVLKQSQELNQQASADLAVATEKVNSLVKDSNVEELKQNIENETKAVETAKETVSTTEQALDAAKQAETNYSKALSDAQKVVANAQNNAVSAFNNLEATKSELAVASTKEENAQKDLEEAQKGKTETTIVQVGTETTVKNAEAKVKPGIVTLKVADDGEAVYTNDAYLQAIKKLADGTGTVEEVRQAAKDGYDGFDLTQNGPLYSLPSSSNYKKDSSNSRYNTLKVSDNDEKVYDVFALPEEKVRDLALFYAALVNEMRSKVGNQNYLVVTDEAMDSIKKSLDSAFTKFTTRTLNGEFHTAGKDRNTPGLLTNLDEFQGITNSFTYYSWEDSALQKEDATTHVTTVSTYPSYGKFGDGLKLTMSQLKSHLVQVVGEQLYQDLDESRQYNSNKFYNYEAALAILGLDGKNYNSVGLDLMPANTSSIGGAIDSFPSFFTRLMKSDAPAYENPYMEFIGGEIATTPIYETKETVVVDEKAVQVATEALENAKSETLAAQSSYEKAKESYELAKTGLEVAQENLTSIKSGEVDVHVLEDALAEAKKNLSEAEARLEADKVALALAESSEAEKIRALENAKFELAQAEDKKAKSDAQLAQDKDYLELASNGLEMTKQALAQAEANLKVAQEKQATAKAHYESVSATFDKREETLAALYVQLKEAETALESAKAQEKVEIAKLEELKATASDLWAKYLDLKARYDAQKGNVNSQQVADKAKEIIESGNKVVPVVDGSGKVVDVVSDNSVQTTNKDNVVLVDGEEHQVLEDGSLKKVEKAQVDNGGKPSTTDKGNNSTNSGNNSTNNGNSAKAPSTNGQKVPVGFTVGSSYVNLPSDSKGTNVSKSVKADEVRSLPNTSSVTSAALSAIGAVVGMFGLAATKRKKD